MKTQNRILSFLLTFGMLLSLCVAFPFFTMAEGWDGTTATQPEGSGTLTDPYLVATAENLLWIQKQIPRGEGVVDTDEAVTAGNYGVAFKDVYFLQTNDIDLNGKSFKSIGYYFANAKRMAAFGGTYDGQGFSIRNGKIESQNATHDLNVNWGHGLFGMIYGATIKNIVLDNVTVFGHGVTGAIVGRAVATADDSGKAENLNIVENCVVKSNCAVSVSYPSSVTDVSTLKAYDQASRAGGIVGMAYGTTVRYCVNNATVSVPGNWAMTGGIVGSAGYNTLVEYCVNKGKLAYNLAQYVNKAENAVGGIVGFISPYTSGLVDKSFSGNMIIRNCYNSGEFVITAGSNELGNALYWGGILGGANSIHATTNKIENCYNLHALKKGANGIPETYTKHRIGGLLGSYWIKNGASVGSIEVLNSYSVDVDEYCYSGSNQCRYYNTRKTASGVLCVVEDTSAQKTAEEIAPYTTAIDTAIADFTATATAKKIGSVAYQFSTGTKNSVRFSAQIIGKDYDKAGFKVTASYQDGDTVKTSETYDMELYSYYTSLIADSAAVTPNEGNYFVAFVIDNIPTDKGNITFTLQPYVVAEGVVSFGYSVSVTFGADGTVVE